MDFGNNFFNLLYKKLVQIKNLLNNGSGGGGGGIAMAAQVAYDPTLNPGSILEVDDVQDALDQIIIRGIDLRDITGLDYAGTSIAGIRYKATPGLPPNYNQSVQILSPEKQKMGSVNISAGGDMWFANANNVPLVYLWQGGSIVPAKGYIRLIDFFNRLNVIEYKFSPDDGLGQRRGFTVLREVNAVTNNQEMGLLSNLKTDDRTSVISAINSIYKHSVLTRSIVNTAVTGTPITGCVIHLIDYYTTTPGSVGIKNAKTGQIIGSITWDENNIAVNKTIAPAQSIYLKQNGQTTGVINVLLADMFTNIGTVISAIVFAGDFPYFEGDPASDGTPFGFDVIRIVDIDMIDKSVGLLADLETADKTSLVHAINELKQRMDTLEGV